MTCELPLVEESAPAPSVPPPGAPVQPAEAGPLAGALPAPPAARAESPARRWLVEQVLLPCYRPVIPAESVWQWADRDNVYLSDLGTGRAGYYRSRLTPWTREFQETATSDRFDEDHVLKSSRVGFTEAFLNVLRFMPDHMPGPALLALDSLNEGKDVNRERLIPTLRDSNLTDDEDDVASKRIKLRNMIIKVAGSYSAGTFRNKGYKVIGLDEVEVNDSIEHEGTTHDLARSRQSDVPGAKLFTMSKAKRWASAHHRECATGTLSAYLVPCPHCGTFQELSLDGESPTHYLRLDEPLTAGAHPLSPRLGHQNPDGSWCEVPAPRLGRLQFSHCKNLLGEWDDVQIERDTWYECVRGCHITGEETLTAAHAWLFPGCPEVADRLTAGETMNAKLAMMLAGRWLQTNHRPKPRKRSRHISDLYSLHEKLSWGRLAARFVEVAHDPGRLPHFLNNHMGLPSRERGGAVGDKHLLQCLEPYQRGTTPFVPAILLIGVDSQFDHWKFVVAAYLLNRERAVVNWGRAGTVAELLDEFNRPVTLASDPARTFLINRGFVDAAGAEGTTDRVYSLCRHSWSQQLGHPRLFPAFGRDYTTNTKVIWDSEILHEFRPLRIYFFGDEIFKRRLYLGSILQVAEIKAAISAGHEPELKGLPPRLRLPAAPVDGHRRALLDELQSEQLNPKGKWAKTRGAPNDFGDALKLCDVMFDHVRPRLLAERAEREAAEAAAKTAAAAKKPA